VGGFWWFLPNKSMVKTQTTARVGLTSSILEIIKDASPKFDMDYYNSEFNICFATFNSVFA
jgi:4-hydroxy-3-methylbut-2-enyl diphosphate reductase IspH